MVDEPARCTHSGTVRGSPGLRGLCPACLLGLALAGEDDGGEASDEFGADALIPGPTYRVLTILASEDGRATYLAEQGDRRRLVTLDVVTLPQPQDPASNGALRLRLEALKQLAHPAIARVTDGRHTPSGDFCVVAHHVAGPRLDRACETRHIDPAERARLFALVCEAVAYGHRHGVCHGRLRPECVLASGSREAMAPVVIGYSVVPGRTPTEADDRAGLEILARAMGCAGPDGRP
jgi:hypothetical protein